MFFWQTFLANIFIYLCQGQPHLVFLSKPKPKKVFIFMIELQFSPLVPQYKKTPCATLSLFVPGKENKVNYFTTTLLYIFYSRTTVIWPTLKHLISPSRISFRLFWPHLKNLWAGIKMFWPKIFVKFFVDQHFFGRNILSFLVQPLLSHYPGLTVSAWGEPLLNPSFFGVWFRIHLYAPYGRQKCEIFMGSKLFRRLRLDMEGGLSKAPKQTYFEVHSLFKLYQGWSLRNQALFKGTRKKR